MGACKSYYYGVLENIKKMLGHFRPFRVIAISCLNFRQSTVSAKCVNAWVENTRHCVIIFKWKEWTVFCFVFCFVVVVVVFGGWLLIPLVEYRRRGNEAAFC